jgi:hypothetical protein
MPNLIGRATGETLGREPVLQVDRNHHCLSTEFRRHPPLLPERACHCNHRLIPLLHHPVLLQGVRHREVSHDTLVGAVGNEFSRREHPHRLSTSLSLALGRT